MNIYVYSDESGVFDVKHNEYFVFGGIIIIGNQEKETYTRKYISVEKLIRDNEQIPKEKEVKASCISNTNKNNLYKSLNQCYKFGIIINQKKLHNEIFNDKKSKQRFLDFAYKLAVKNALQNMISKHIISAANVDHLYFYVDEHSTATNGKYELHEALEQELLHGTFNYNYNKFYPPILPNASSVNVEFWNSASTTLVREADIVANHM